MAINVDYRRANYIPMITNGKADILRSKFRNLRFLVPTYATLMVTDQWAHNLPGLAHHLYKVVDFWWVLAEYNGIIDPINDMYSGRVLNLPRYEDVVAVLSDNVTNIPPGAITNLVVI